MPGLFDLFFRYVMTDPMRAHDFLRHTMPNEIAGWLVDEPPEILEGTFVDETLKGSQSDLLMRVRLTDGSDGFVYLLAEHKSAPDPGLPLQLATYMVRIWKRHVGEGLGKLRALPPIVPVVIYHGEPSWSGPESLRDMIATPDPVLAYLPGERYVLRALRDMDIKKRTRDPGLRAGLGALRGDGVADVARSLPEEGDILKVTLEFLRRVHKITNEELAAELRKGGRADMEALAGSLADTTLKQGRAEGRVEGRAEGRVEGRAETLVRQLERRFGPLSRKIRRRIDGADIAELDAWLDGVIDAPDLKSVFGGKRLH